MPVIDVMIVKRAGGPAWPELESVMHLPDALWRVAAMEGGMSSGAPSIALRLDLPEGVSILAETSLAAWIAATAAFRGAFPEAFADGPLRATTADDALVQVGWLRGDGSFHSLERNPNPAFWCEPVYAVRRLDDSNDNDRVAAPVIHILRSWEAGGIDTRTMMQVVTGFLDEL
jgi:hypothetical protein